MEVQLFFKAALLGLSIAAPVGPIGLLCIQRTLAHGARIGFVSGLGAATADGVYGAVGAFGLTALTKLFTSIVMPMTIGGALFLGWMGGGLLLKRPTAATASGADTVRAGRAYASVFALTLANPLTILSFVAMFAGIGGAAMSLPGAAAIMVAGITAGSALWWLILAGGVAAVRHRIGPGIMLAINRTAGAGLLGFAMWQITSVLR